MIKNIGLTEFDAIISEKKRCVHSGLLGTVVRTLQDARPRV